MESALARGDSRNPERNSLWLLFPSSSLYEQLWTLSPLQDITYNFPLALT